MDAVPPKRAGRRAARPGPALRLAGALLLVPAAAATVAADETAPQRQLEAPMPPPARPAPPGERAGEPSAEADVASLARPGARGDEAAERLLRRGASSLVPLHRALRDPATPTELRTAVVHLLGELGDPRSVPVLVEAARSVDAPDLTREVLRALGSMPRDPAGFGFLEAVLVDPDAPSHERGQALVALALQREPRGAPWADRLRTSPDPALRAAALFLCAALGDTSALEPVTALLAERPDADFRYSLLLALAELVGPAEFETRAAPTRRFALEYDSAHRIARFRAGDAAARADLFRSMLASRFPHERHLAVRDLLARGEVAALEPLLARWRQVAPPIRTTIAAELHRAGYRLAERDRRLVIVDRSS